MPEVTVPDTTSLQRAVSGSVVLPEDEGYDEARAVWNAEIDRRPAVIVRCADAADVSAAVLYARAQGLEIAVRGGAHSTSGSSSVDDGLVIDLGTMRQVTVDPATRRTVVAGGALLGDVDAAAQPHGLAAPGGLISHTGVAGLTLGGGMGWLTRKAGLALDNLVSAQIVTADGEVRRASADENVELFWALRGGGGNFGVVTEFEFRLHEVGPLVSLSLFYWRLEDGPRVFRLARDLVPALSTDLNVLVGGVSAPEAPFVPQAYHHQPCYLLALVGFGAPEAYEAAVDRIRGTVPPLFEMATPIPFVQLQQMLDEANAWGFHVYDKALYLEDLSDEAITVVTEHMPRRTSAGSAALFYRLDGAYSAVDDDDTAFGGGRSPRYCCFLIGLSDSRDGLDAERAWVRTFWEALLPHAMGAGSYVNGEAEHPQDRVVASYGPEKYARLARAKAEYDPDNVFHRNANILPAPRPPMPREGGG